MIDEKRQNLSAQPAFAVPSQDEPKTTDNVTAIIQEYMVQLDGCANEDDVMQVR